MRGGRQHSTLTFIVILALTVLVWFAVAMSEVHEYPLKVKVEMSGFDSSRYAVVQSDSMVTLQVESTGFNALLYSLKGETIVLKLNMNGESVRTYSQQTGREKNLYRVVAVNDLGDRMADELSVRGMRLVSSVKDSLRLVLSERKSKVFRVDVSGVKTSFAEGYGMYGEPTVSPSEVTLYGDEESLSKIEKVSVVPTNIDGITKGGTFTLSLDTTWRRDDVYASTDKVTLKLSVEQYVEREYTLPIDVEGLEGSTKLNLYPDKATVSVWVPRRDLASVTAERFSLAVDYNDVMAHASKLKVRLIRFPRTVRVHNISPAEITYVVYN